jgi:hypothetical protein
MHPGWRFRSWELVMSAAPDRWIRWTTTGCVALLALISGTVSYLHMHLLVELHGQPGWVSALAPLSVDGMIVAASTPCWRTREQESVVGSCPGRSWWWAVQRAWPPTSR